MDASAGANAHENVIPEKDGHLDDHVADVAPKPEPVVDHNDTHNDHPAPAFDITGSQPNNVAIPEAAPATEEEEIVTAAGHHLTKTVTSGPGW